MATIPKKETIEAANAMRNETSTHLANAIRDKMPAEFRNDVSRCDGTLEGLRGFGDAVTSYDAYYTPFMKLLGRIAFVVVKNALFENPFAIFKKGILEYGESIEEIFIQMSEPHQYDKLDDLPEWHMLKEESTEIETAFYRINYQVYYKKSIRKREVKMAFLSENGVADLIDRIVQTMYQAATLDNYLIVMYMLGRKIVEGKMRSVYVDDTNMDKFMGYIRGLSNDLSLPAGSNYTESGVINPTPISKQVVLISSWFEGTLDAESLAYAFHDDKVNFLQRKLVINKFSDIDFNRVKKLLSTKKGQTFKEFTEEELNFLDSIKVIDVSEDYFMLYTAEYEMTDFFNGEKLGWNYWLHDWEIIATSPFETAVAITSTDNSQGVDITINPSRVTISELNKVTPVTVTVSGGVGITKKADFFINSIIGNYIPVWEEVSDNAINLKVLAPETGKYQAGTFNLGATVTLPNGTKKTKQIVVTVNAPDA